MSDYAELIIFNGVKPWPHELETAVSLVKSGHTVVFRAKSEKYKVQTADILLDGQIWELKAPNGKKLSAVERNLRRGKNQSSRIVFDSRRMKGVPDKAIMREILSKAHFITDIDKIIYINKHGDCIDIYNK